MSRFVIRNAVEYVAAVKRAEALTTAAPGSVGARERDRLSEAMKVYDDAIAMMRGVSRKAAGEREDDVPNISGAE